MVLTYAADHVRHRRSKEIGGDGADGAEAEAELREVFQRLVEEMIGHRVLGALRRSLRSTIEPATRSEHHTITWSLPGKRENGQTILSIYDQDGMEFPLEPLSVRVWFNKRSRKLVICQRHGLDFVGVTDAGEQERVAVVAMPLPTREGEPGQGAAVSRRRHPNDIEYKFTYWGTLNDPEYVTFTVSSDSLAFAGLRTRRWTDADQVRLRASVTVLEGRSSPHAPGASPPTTNRWQPEWNRYRRAE